MELDKRLGNLLKSFEELEHLNEHILIKDRLNS